MGWHFQWWQSSPYIARFSKVVVPDSMCTVGVAADAVMSVSMPPPLPGAPWHARWNQVGHVWVSQVNQHRWGTGDVGKCEPVREPVCVCVCIYGEQIFAYWWWTGADWILLWVLCCLFCFLPINFSIQVQSSLKFVKCSVSIRLCESQRCFVCRAVQNCHGCSGWFTCK